MNTISLLRIEPLGKNCVTFYISFCFYNLFVRTYGGGSPFQKGVSASLPVLLSKILSIGYLP